MSTSTSTPTPPRTKISIAICGGGIGGLALAIGLLRHPHLSVHIYESAPAFAEIGAGVSFGPNAMRAMRLIDPSVQRGYDRRRTENEAADKKDAWFDFRWGMDLKRSPDGGPGGGRPGGGKAGEWFHSTIARGTGSSSIHRAHFLDELVALVPGECTSFGKHVEALTQLEDGDGDGGGRGRVEMNFKDGSTALADAVVGCDGIKSQVRVLLLGKENRAARAQFTGKYAYRGLIPMDRAVDLLGEELARNSQMYFGYHGHMLTFPIERGKTMNVVAFRTSKTGTWEDERWVVPMKREEMERDFDDWGQDVKSVLSLMEKTDLWALFDHPPAEKYYKGRVCLMGDAAHASTPHQGAGAGMALEDAYVLSNLLGLVEQVDEIDGAFRVFDATRRPRTQKLVTTSRECGETYDLENEDVGDDVQKLKRNLDERQRWIWDHDLEGDMVKAREMMMEERSRLHEKL